MTDRYEVFAEDINGETHWGVYDNDTSSVVEWYATEDEARQYLCVPDERGN